MSIDCRLVVNPRRWKDVGLYIGEHIPRMNTITFRHDEYEPFVGLEYNGSQVYVVRDRPHSGQKIADSLEPRYDDA